MIHFLSRYEKRGEFPTKDGSDWEAQTTWKKLDMAISICVNEGYTLHHVSHCPSHGKYCCFSTLIVMP